MDLLKVCYLNPIILKAAVQNFWRSSVNKQNCMRLGERNIVAELLFSIYV